MFVFFDVFNKQSTTSENSINLGIISKVIEQSFKIILPFLQFSLTIFEIFLLEDRFTLSFV